MRVDLDTVRLMARELPPELMDRFGNALPAQLDDLVSYLNEDTHIKAFAGGAHAAPICGRVVQGIRVWIDANVPRTRRRQHTASRDEDAHAAEASKPRPSRAKKRKAPAPHTVGPLSSPTGT